jgi:hypothetical protein
LKTVLFTFEDDAARDQFLAAVQGAAETMVSSSDVPEGFEGREAAGELILGTLNTAKFDPPIKEDHERQCSLWVSGEKLIEGNLSDMQKRFQQECSSHSASVVLKEYRGGEWHDIRARRLQPS